ncbi:hypothetical protein CANARDRAFT_30300 [[Candida] arabinofermentans NRRL YB-2248]|uniref:Uncharacterized protein n=1 Tax=[Candida] arabinofermentans NRRL YB-2248 TaxID=983967 RepID=A0A1E4SUG4_9ASCO|nr:hypothetical protein CANARDRAFT_30300 [[Candida] arabinofermentans NRRL YB-2248]
MKLLNDYSHDQKRSDSYYFIKYTQQEILQFENVALSGDDIIRLSEIKLPSNGKVIDITQHNKRIDELIKPKTSIKKKKKSRRMGKNQRLGILAKKERLLQYEKSLIDVDSRVQQWLKYHNNKSKKKTRRGGKRHRKTTT